MRVPFIVTGPELPKNVQSDVMVNGLDFYPTFLSLAGIERPQNKTLDGCDLTSLLRDDPANASLVRERDGSVRDTMVWHFPNSVAMERLNSGSRDRWPRFAFAANTSTQDLESEVRILKSEVRSLRIEKRTQAVVEALAEEEAFAAPRARRPTAGRPPPVPLPLPVGSESPRASALRFLVLVVGEKDMVALGRKII